MRGIFIITFIMLLAKFGFAQKEQNIWIDGLYAGIDFNSGTPVSFRRPVADDTWRTSATVCDTAGNLLFFTNGFRVFNRNYEIMQNGDSLNLGDYFSWGYDELPTPDGAVILPNYYAAGKYYIFHTDLNYIYDAYLGDPLFTFDLYYDVVDMSLDGGLGGIVQGQKEILFFSDTLANTGIQAVRHGNGRDWWLICHEYNSNNYYRFLLDKNGIHGPFTQGIGLIYTEYNAFVYNGDIKFNQQGTQMIKDNSDSSLFELYDFDRCSGLLSNRRQVRVSDTLNQLWGLSFSPSGRYAYISANYETELFQFDLWVTDIEASKTLIGVYDGTLNPFETWFYKMDIGPDGKVYIGSYDTDLSLHVINDPDSAGLKCNFVQNQLELPPVTYWGGGMPNLPNYHLGAIAGCDTVVTSIPSINQNAFTHIYPNPATDQIQIQSQTSKQKTISILTLLGQLVFQNTFYSSESINVSSFPKGIYIVKISDEHGNLISTEKLVKE